MNTELLAKRAPAGHRRSPVRTRRGQPRRSIAGVTLRTATAADAPALHALIEAHLVEGHLLPRTLEELTAHASRFLVAVRRQPGRSAIVVACAELAPLSAQVAEVRSLVVDRSARAMGIGRSLINALRTRAIQTGFDRLCAFTHDAGYFVRKGFSIVPHHWVPEKIATDCAHCALFRKCGQYAVLLPLRG
jgi:amino-acid N-acetyltransferase